MRTWSDVRFLWSLALWQFVPSPLYAASSIVPTQALAWLPGESDPAELIQLKNNIMYSLFLDMLCLPDPFQTA